MMTIRNTASVLSLLAGTALASSICPPANPQADIQIGEIPVLRCGVGEVVQQQAYIDVVFVLDTTGSMGGLIEGAKQKIWAIANQIAQAQPAPVVRMGLVGYRDRGDKYVTTITELTEDIDTVYADLMAYQAQGGGDTPESVNEALFQAVERFDWTDEANALKLIYLVGDAPPKMEYQDDIKFHASCRLAYEQDININTIQCGTMSETRAIWQEIAQLARGAYAAIEQGGGVVAISTPYDEEIARCDAQLGLTMVDYGDEEVLAFQQSKRERGSKISADAPSIANADRAMYNQSEAGRKNMFGMQELVDDVTSGRVKIEAVEKEQLPEEMQSLSTEELKAEIDQRKTQRDELNAKIRSLAGKRAEYLSAHQPEAAKDGFDQKVLEALIEQGARVGINFGGEDSPEPTAD